MSPRRTIASAVCFLVLLGAYGFQQRRLAQIEEEKLTAASLVPAKPEQVQRLSIFRSGLTLELRREGEGWEIINPIQTEADAQTMNDLLIYLTIQQRANPVKITEAERGTYGLAEPALRVAARVEGREEEIRFAIGENSPAHGEVYAMLEGGDEFFTVSSELRDHLAAPIFDFRDKSLLPINATEATSLLLTREGATLEAVKEAEAWKLTRPAAAPADAERVAAVLRDLHLTKAVDFIDTDTLVLEKYGLGANPLVATVAKGEERATLLVGHRRLKAEAGEPTYYALRQGRDQIFTIPQALEQALRADALDLRAKEIFTLTREEATTFTLAFGEAVFSLERDAEKKWRFADAPEKQVDQREAEMAVARLLAVKAAEYLPVQPLDEISGLDAPLLRLTVGDGKEKTEGIETGTAEARRDRVYARKLGGGEVFMISGEIPGGFFLTREKFEARTLFAFDPKRAAAIRIGQGGLALNLRADGEHWYGQFEGKDQRFQVNPAIIEVMVMSMANLKWDRRLNPESELDQTLIASMDLESPDRSIQVTDAAGTELAYIGQGGQDDREVYVALRGEKQYYAVPLQDYLTFFRAIDAAIPKQ